MKRLTYTIIASALLWATGCPEDNNDTPMTNNTKVDMIEDMVGSDMSEDMPGMDDMDMTLGDATECDWVRTEPATLPLDGPSHKVKFVLLCNGVVPKDGINVEIDGADGSMDSIECRPSDLKPRSTWCDLNFDLKLNKPAEQITAKDAGAYPTRLILIAHNGEGNMADHLRFHQTPEQMAAEYKDVRQLNKVPNGLGMGSLGAHTKALDDGQGAYFGVTAHKVLIEKDLEKQRQEILKNLEVEFGTIGATGAFANVTTQTPMLGDGELVYHHSGMARTPTGFQALWWGQANDTTSGAASLVGVLYNLDSKGQPVGSPLVLKPAATTDPLKQVISSQLYQQEELDRAPRVSYSAGVLHTTMGGKWQLTQLFYADGDLPQDSTRSSGLFDTFGGVTTSEAEQGKAWVGLMDRPIVNDPADASFQLVGWSAKPDQDGGVNFGLVSVETDPPSALVNVKLPADFAVANVHVGLAAQSAVMVLLVSAQGEQALYSLTNVGDTVNATPMMMPPLTDLTPASFVPAHSAFEAVATQRDLVPLLSTDKQSFHLSSYRSTRERMKKARRRQQHLSEPAYRTNSTNGYGAGALTTWSVTDGQIVASGIPKGSGMPVMFKKGEISTYTAANSRRGAYDTIGDGCVLTTNVCHFRIVSTSPTGGAVIYDELKLKYVADLAADGGGIPLGLDDLPVDPASFGEPTIVSLANELKLIAMSAYSKREADTTRPGALVLSFMDKGATSGSSVAVNFGANVQHETVHIAGMGTEVLVFFMNDAGNGNLAILKVDELKDLTQNNKMLASIDVKNAVDLGPVFGDAQLFTNNRLLVNAFKTPHDVAPTSLLAAEQFAMIQTGQNCGTYQVATITDTMMSMLTPLDFFSSGMGETCEGQEHPVARGDFLGTGGEQVLTFDGQGFNMLYHSTEPKSLGTSLPEKFIVARDGGRWKVIGPNEPGSVGTIVAEDFNGDGLTDLAIDQNDGGGMVILFSDGLGGTLPSSGIIDGVSGVLGGGQSGIMARPFGFGKGTKATASQTSTKPQLL